MNEYILLFSQYCNNSSFLTYDIVYYNNAFYAGTNLFKNFSNYLANDLRMPVKMLSNYEQAKQHFNTLT